MEFVVGERATPFGDHGVHQIGEQSVVGLATQAFEDRLEVVLSGDLLLGRPDGFVLGLHHPESLHPGIGPGLDLPDVLFGGTHLTADDDEREGNGELAHPVARTAFEETVDETMSESFDERIEFLDLGWAEGVIEESAHLAMFGVVATGQGRTGDPTFLLVDLPQPRRTRIDPASVAGTREALGVEQNGLDVVVPRDHEHAGEVVAPHRSLVAKRGISRVRAIGHVRIEKSQRFELDVVRLGHVAILAHWHGAPESVGVTPEAVVGLEHFHDFTR